MGKFGVPHCQGMFIRDCSLTTHMGVRMQRAMSAFEPTFNQHPWSLASVSEVLPSTGSSSYRVGELPDQDARHDTLPRSFFSQECRAICWG